MSRITDKAAFIQKNFRSTGIRDESTTANTVYIDNGGLKLTGNVLTVGNVDITSTSSGVKFYTKNTTTSETVFVGGIANLEFTSANNNLRVNTVDGNAYDTTIDVSDKATWTALTGTNTAIRTLVADRMQVANVNSINTTLTASVADRMQVANTVALVNDRMQVANVNSLLTSNTDPTFRNGSFTGWVEIDGDLIVSGNTISVGATNLSISNNFIYINDGGGNTIVDMGWAGGYANSGYAHAGVFRDATDGRFKVFDGYTPEPGASVFINTSHASYDHADLQVGTLYADDGVSVNGTDLITEINSNLSNTNNYIAAERLVSNNQLANTNSYIATKVSTTTFNSALANTNSYIGNKLNSSSYTASDVLTKIKTVDGTGSGLDADTVDGIQASSFLRSDTDDSASGNYTISGSINLSNHNTVPRLKLNSGDSSTFSYNKGQIEFSYYSTGDYSHYISTNHQSSGVAGNGFRFLTSDGTENNTIDTGVIVSLEIDGGDLKLYNNSNTHVSIWDASTQRLGIGTIAPEGSGIDVTKSRTTSYSSTSDQRSLAHIIARNVSDAATRFSSISLVNGGGTQAEGSINLVQRGNYIGDLAFKLRTGGSTWAEQMRISSNGNVGIGTTSPGAPLDFGVTSPNQQVIKLRRNNNSTTGLAITSDYGVRVFGPSDASSTGNLFEVGKMDVSNGTSFLGSLFNVRYDGNVGIGTDTPKTSLDISNRTGAFAPPKGSTAERPWPNGTTEASGAVHGAIRHNTDTGVLEQYIAEDLWVSIAPAMTVTSVALPGSQTAVYTGDTITIGGLGFDSGATASYIHSNGTEYAAPTTSYISGTQLTSTIPSGLPEGTYDLKVTNQTGVLSILDDAFDVDGVAVFNSPSGSLGTLLDNSGTANFDAGATEDGSAVNVAVTTGSLPSGLSMNSTGSITGTPSTNVGSDTVYTFTVTATDTENQTSTRQFSITILENYMNTDSATFGDY
jgi:hypothetical protein